MPEHSHPALACRVGPKSAAPTAPQLAAWAAIVGGRRALIGALTGSPLEALLNEIRRHGRIG